MIPSDPGFYKDLLDQMSDGVYFVDRNRKIVYWNEGARRLTGYAADEVVGRHCQENILSHVDCTGTNLCYEGCPLSDSIFDGSGHEARMFLRHKQGRRLPVRVRVQPIRNAEGAVVGAVEIFSDDSAQTDAQRRLDELRRMAYLDHLTQMPNRRYLEMSFESALHEYRMSGQTFGVIALDMDSFKEINDNHGHCQGDQALQEAAKTIAASLRPRDIAGRWGGDEFLAIVANVDEAALGTLAERCVRMVSSTTLSTSDASVVRLSVSMGATLCWPGATAADLIQKADELMYLSKTNGRGRVTFGSVDAIEA